MIPIELTFINVDIDILSSCKVGTEVTIWTRPELEFIYFFEAGTYNGQGRIGKLHKAKIPGLTVYTDASSVEVVAVEGSTCVLKIEVDADPQGFAEAQRAGWQQVDPKT